MVAMHHFFSFLFHQLIYVKIDFGNVFLQCS